MATFKALKGVHELRLALCQTGAASEGVREFVRQHYPALKAANPGLPVLIRESAGAPARLTARFDRGREEAVPLDGLSAAAVALQVTALAARA